VAGGAATRGRERFLLVDFLEERLGVLLVEMKGRAVVLRALLVGDDGDDNVTIEAEAEARSSAAIAIGFFQHFITHTHREREGCAAFALGGWSRALRASLKWLCTCLCVRARVRERAVSLWASSRSETESQGSRSHSTSLATRGDGTAKRSLTVNSYELFGYREEN
jgi:hypothetical protein